MAKEYDGTVKKIEGDQAIVEIIDGNYGKMEVVFHKDTLERCNACEEGARIKYTPYENKIRVVTGFFGKLGIK
jgi:hypothetical protein